MHGNTVMIFAEERVIW